MSRIVTYVENWIYFSTQRLNEGQLVARVAKSGILKELFSLSLQSRALKLESIVKVISWFGTQVKTYVLLIHATILKNSARISEGEERLIPHRRRIRPTRKKIFLSLFQLATTGYILPQLTQVFLVFAQR